MNKRASAIVVVAVAVVLLTAVVLAGFNLNLNSQVTSGKSVVQTAQDNGNFTKLVGALNATGLSDTLNGSGPFTVFAPTDTAFAAMNQTLLNNLTKDKANLSTVLKFHVVQGKVLASQLSNNMTLKTLDGSELVVIANTTGTYVDGAKIVSKDIQCSNGVIHAIDMVLVPQTIMQVIGNTSNLSILNAALEKANLTTALNGSGPFTVFAPLNSAFNSSASKASLDQMMSTNDTANLTKVLTYHVLPYRLTVGNNTNSSILKTVQGSFVVLTVNSSGVFVNDAKVVTSNIECTNGVIYTIDKVLIPPKTVLETAKDNGGLTKLLGAIDTANLTTALNGTGPYTVFAPSDAAFSALDQAVLSKLTTSDKQNLTKLLSYHVVPGMVMSFNLNNTTTLTTLEGEKLNVSVNGTVIKIGNATIITKDIIASNGVIHVIDRVLVPPSMGNLTAASTGNSSSTMMTMPSGG